jgi:entericidin B
LQVVDSLRHGRWHAACNDLSQGALRGVPGHVGQSTEGNIMKRMIALTLAAAYVFIAGCNTIQGAGKDIERGGEKIQSEAQEHKKY